VRGVRARSRRTLAAVQRTTCAALAPTGLAVVWTTSWVSRDKAMQSECKQAAASRCLTMSAKRSREAQFEAAGAETSVWDANNTRKQGEQSAAERREEGGGDDGWGEGWSWGEEVMFACVGAASELRVGLAAESKQASKQAAYGRRRAGKPVFAYAGRGKADHSTTQRQRLLLP
jgi:hypothetical protein